MKGWPALGLAAALMVAAAAGAVSYPQTQSQSHAQAQTQTQTDTRTQNPRQARVGARFADVTLVDQVGAPVTLGSFTGKRLLIGFATASEGAAGACASISGKFAYLQHRIDPRRVHLFQISADPADDSTSGVLRAYARAYGIEASRWTVASGAVPDVSAVDAKLVQAAQAARIGDVFGSAVAVIDERGRLLAVLDASTSTPDRLLREAFEPLASH